MPVDHKRINGPENTVPYQLFVPLNTKSLESQFNEALRKDGRKASEHRKIFLKTGVVSQAKGSAYIELGHTKVIVSVFDPREIPNQRDYTHKGDIYCEFKYAPFSCHKRRLHQQDADEKQHSAIVKQALESAVLRHEFPNFQIDVYCLVLHSDGSALSAAVTAAGVALAHAGIPMYDLITCATVGVQGDLMILDPDLDEENLCRIPLKTKTKQTEPPPQNHSDDEDQANNSGENHGLMTLAMLSTQEQVSQFFQVGNLSMDCVKRGIEILTKSVKDLVPKVEQCLVQYVVKNTKHSARED